MPVQAKKVTGHCPGDSGRQGLDRDIAENAKGFLRAEGDSGSAEQHRLTDQIEADRYLRANSARRSPLGGIRCTKLIPPGTAEIFRRGDCRP